MAKALDSLCLYHPGLALSEYGDFGPHGGRKRSVRLTSEGQLVAAERREKTV